MVVIYLWTVQFKILRIVIKMSIIHAVYSIISAVCNPVALIDISWVDWAYKSSTCDVMYCRQRRHLYYSGQIQKYYLPPPPQLSLHKNAALSSNSKGTRSPPTTMRMLMIYIIDPIECNVYVILYFNAIYTCCSYTIFIIDDCTCCT
jgi:hypothetical protein